MPDKRPSDHPIPVTAAGGIVVRQTGSGPMVLLIHRKGRWDLPKGKLDPGETIEECARREVCEELGIDSLHIDAPIGHTVHRYRDGKRSFEKTTWWYRMRTGASRFRPQRSEKITAVVWMDPEAAIEHLAFDTLKGLLRANLTQLDGT